MGALVAKIKNNEQWVLISDQVEIDVLNNINLTDTMLYDPNNQMAHQWFRIEELRNSDFFNPLFSNMIETGELQTIDAQHLDEIKFFAFFSEGKFYIQRLLTGCYIKKASFWSLGERIQFSNDNKMVTINTIPDGIYDVNQDILYFQELNRLYSIFPNIRSQYVEGTANEISDFLSNDMIALSDGFSEENVSVSNRKRIYMVARDYNSYTQEEKSSLKEYIHQFSNGDLEYNEDSQNFNIHNDTELRLLLYGMQMRFYRQPLNQDVQVATSTTSISSLI